MKYRFFLANYENLSKENHHVHGIKFSRNYRNQSVTCRFEKVQRRCSDYNGCRFARFSRRNSWLYNKIVDEKYDFGFWLEEKRFDNVMTKNLPSKFFNSADEEISLEKNYTILICGLKVYRKQTGLKIKVMFRRFTPMDSCFGSKFGFKNYRKTSSTSKARP